MTHAISPSVSPPSLLSSSTASHPSTSTQPHSPPPASSSMAHPQPNAHLHSLAHPHSPARPHTPPRGRARYAALSRDPSRVPLHRRGTSKTYERLEDLLREAGYKETRIFTPEQERAEAAARGQEQEHSRGSMRGVGAVVGFFAGLVQGQAPSPQPKQKAAEETDAGPWSPPASPLAHKHKTPRPTPRPAPIFTTSPSPSPSSASSSAASSAARPLAHAQLRRLRQQRPSSEHDGSGGSTPSMRPQFSLPDSASPARAYLRHMASAPDMARRAPAAVQRRATQGQEGGCGAEDEEGMPPMPPSWLETVAKALLGAPLGTTVGGPASSRASTVRGVAAFGGAGERGRGTARPALMTGASAGRARESPGVVVARHVVCRSAPVSRDGSRVRGAAVQRLEETGTVRGRGKKGKGKKRKRGEEAGPSLKGRVEGEGEGEGSGWTGAAVSLEGPETDEEDEDEDEEGELDLARLLVHPKRQQSIQSLRRHLRPMSTAEGVGAKTWLPEDDDLHVRAGEPRGRGAGRGESSRRASVEDGEWAGAAVGGSRRRRGLPRAWTDWTAR